MRSLLVAKDTAWPRDTGYRQRLDAVGRGLAAAGEHHHLTVAVPGASLPPDLPPHVASARSAAAPWHPRPRAAAAFAAARDPHFVTGRDWAQVRAAVAGSGALDLVWCSHVDVWAGVRGALPDVPVVVDLDNVMSVLVARRAASAPPLLRTVLREDARRWARLERAALRDSAAVAVCSRLDADRLARHDAAGRLVVVPNGGDGQPPAPRPPARPVLLLVASLDYGPNSEAALWCAEQVLPRVREAVPDAVLRVVGREGAASERLRALPGVEVAGRVDDVAPELAAAAVAVVPVLQGGGTRIKALEAFGAGLPTVATTVGVEGLAAEPGRHLLVADGPEGFAAACVRVLRDPALARQLGAAARALHAEQGDWELVPPQVTALARRLSAG